jgi:hypothetical protein
VDWKVQEDMVEQPHTAEHEERRLIYRIRVYIVVGILSVSLQGVVLASAIESSGSTRVWVLWAAVFAFSATTTAIACVRASRLSKRYRQLKWEEKQAGANELVGDGSHGKTTSWSSDANVSTARN